MNELTTFNFKNNSVRVVTIEREPGLLGTDVCAVLGLQNPGVAYKRLASDEVGYVCRTDIGLAPGKPMTVIFESGLYKLVMRSDKPEARKFQDWVTREVLPAIRKDGSRQRANGYSDYTGALAFRRREVTAKMPLKAIPLPPASL